MRLVLWASPGLRMASHHPEPGAPRHVQGPTLTAAWARLAAPYPLTARTLGILDALCASALDRCAYASLVLHGKTWTAYAVRGATHWSAQDEFPERALAHAVAQVDVSTPAVAPVRPTRSAPHAPTPAEPKVGATAQKALV